MSKRPLYTNKFNLPAEVVAAITKDRYTDESEDPFDYSASTLVAPVQKTVLMKRYPNLTRVFDVVDEYWSFLGSIAHAVLEEAWDNGMGSWTEKRLYLKVLGVILGGKMDVYHYGTIRDYKMTRVYKILKGNYEQWEQQQNIYAQLCRENNWPVHAIKIIVLLRDWNKHEAWKEGYPKAPIVTIPLRVWPEEEAVAFIEKRIKAIQHGETLSDEELMKAYPCSDADRWADITGYAVQKVDAKKAYRVFPTMEEAEKFLEGMKNGDDYVVVQKKKDPTHCLHWCKAASVCLQHNPKWKEEQSVESETETPIF